MVNEALTRHGSTPAPDRRAGAVLLQGVKRQDWRARPAAARALGLTLTRRGEIAYWVVAPDGRSPDGRRTDQREAPRERAHLRSAKLLDGTYRFVCEGRICDRSRDGLRLALARDIA